MTLLFHISDLHFGLEDPAALAWFADVRTRYNCRNVLLTVELLSWIWRWSVSSF